MLEPYDSGTEDKLLRREKTIDRFPYLLFYTLILRREVEQLDFHLSTPFASVR